MSASNSSRVCNWSRNAPSMHEVTAIEFCFYTPRISMQKCSASNDDADPARIDDVLDGLSG